MGLTPPDGIDVPRPRSLACHAEIERLTKHSSLRENLAGGHGFAARIFLGAKQRPAAAVVMLPLGFESNFRSPTFSVIFIGANYAEGFVLCAPDPVARGIRHRDRTVQMIRLNDEQARIGRLRRAVEHCDGDILQPRVFADCRAGGVQLRDNPVLVVVT